MRDSGVRRPANNAATLFQHQTSPDTSQPDVLEQLQGQRARLQRELGSVNGVGVAKAPTERRERIRLDIARVEGAIREQSRGRFRG